MARVLYVEDEAALRTALAAFLRMQGLEVCEAGSYREGLRLLVEQDFDVLVTDEQLGDGSGTELAKRFRRDQERPVLICTATPAQVDEELLTEAEVEILRKPVRPAQLGDWISEHLEHPSDAESGSMHSVWRQLVAEAWAPGEIDRVLLVLLELPGARLLELRREGERLLLLLEGAGELSSTFASERLGVDSWRVDASEGPGRLAVAIPLRWRRQAELTGTLDLAGCESWDMQRLISTLEEARERGLRIANLSSWHRLGLRLMGRDELIQEVLAEWRPEAAERRLLWSSSAPGKEAKSGRL